MALANSMSQGRASPSGNATPEIKLEFCKPAGSQAGSQGLKKLESLCDRANGGAPETAAGAQLALEDARPQSAGAPPALEDAATATQPTETKLAETKTPVGGRTCSVKELAAKVMAARQSLQADRAEARVTPACTRT